MYMCTYVHTYLDLANTLNMEYIYGGADAADASSYPATSWGQKRGERLMYYTREVCTCAPQCQEGRNHLNA